MKKAKILLSLMLIAAMTFTVSMYSPSEVYADGNYSLYITHDYDEYGSSVLACPLCCEKHYLILNSDYAAGSTHRFYVAGDVPDGCTFEWTADSEYISLDANGKYCDVTFLKCSDKYIAISVDVFNSDGTCIFTYSKNVTIVASDYVTPIDYAYAWHGTIDKESFSYTGKAITPKITIVDENNKTLTEGTDYTSKYYFLGEDSYVDEIKEPGEYHIGIFPVNTEKYPEYNYYFFNISVVKPKAQTLTGTASYTKPYSTTVFTLNTKTNGNGKLSYKSSNTSVATVSSTGKVTMKGVGKATITVTAAATSTYAKATKKITVTVKPATNKISSVKNLASKKMKVIYTKSTKASGYQIQYATNSSFKKTKTVTATGTSKTISKLTKGKTYYVRVRGYKKVSGVTYYGAWSAKKSVKIMK